jgi:hypothetical protein
MLMDMEELTVREAREVLRRAVYADDTKTCCFLCHGRARTDQKSLNRYQAEAMKLFYAHTRGDSTVVFHAASIIAGTNASRSNDLSLLRHWGLLHPTIRPENAPPSQKGSRGMSGFYQLTQLGIRFAKNEVEVPKTIVHEWGSANDAWSFQPGCKKINLAQALVSRLKTDEASIVVDGTTEDPELELDSKLSEPPVLKPIDTYYKGYKFRSKLEARWALFFDALGLDWVYESEGYQLTNGEWYLPDFWIRNLAGGMFAEVKPNSDSDVSKSRQLAKDSGKRVWMCVDVPDATTVYEVTLWNEATQEFDIDTIESDSFKGGAKFRAKAATKARSHRFDRPQDNE